MRTVGDSSLPGRANPSACRWEPVIYFTGGGDAARTLSRQVQTAWGDFAHGKAPGWQGWSAGRKVRQFGPGEEMAALLDMDAETLWEPIIPAPQ